MASSPPEENLLPLFVGSIINYTCSNATEVAQWATHIFSRPKLAPDKDVRNGIDPIDSTLPRTLHRAVPRPPTVQAWVYYAVRLINSFIFLSN